MGVETDCYQSDIRTYILLLMLEFPYIYLLHSIFSSDLKGIGNAFWICLCCSVCMWRWDLRSQCNEFYALENQFKSHVQTRWNLGLHNHSKIRFVSWCFYLSISLLAIICVSFYFLAIYHLRIKNQNILWIKYSNKAENLVCKCPPGVVHYNHRMKTWRTNKCSWSIAW